MLCERRVFRFTLLYAYDGDIRCYDGSRETTGSTGTCGGIQSLALHGGMLSVFKYRWYKGQF